MRFYETNTVVTKTFYIVKSTITLMYKNLNHNELLKLLMFPF